MVGRDVVPRGPGRGAYASARRARHQWGRACRASAECFRSGRSDRMATIQADNIVAIVVDRGTREVLRNCLRSEAYQLESFEGAIHRSDRAVAHEALARAVRVVDTFPQMGWEEDCPRA